MAYLALAEDLQLEWLYYDLVLLYLFELTKDSPMIIKFLILGSRLMHTKSLKIDISRVVVHLKFVHF